MSKRTKQIECLARLNEATAGLQEILDFLVEEKLTDMTEVREIISAPSPAKELQLVLKRLSEQEKFQLLEYEWIVLPTERITITIVTENAKREFNYSAF